MAFIRRHYFDLQSGSTVLSYMQRGNITIGGIDTDLAAIGRDMSNTGVMEWMEPDPEIERGFTNAWSVHVDVGKLVFSFDPPPAEDTGEEDITATEAVNILIGGDTT